LGCLNNHCYHGYLYHFIGFALEPLDLHKKKRVNTLTDLLLPLFFLTLIIQKWIDFFFVLFLTSLVTLKKRKDKPITRYLFIMCYYELRNL
jgi:hypothetical protein